MQRCTTKTNCCSCSRFLLLLLITYFPRFRFGAVFFDGQVPSCVTGYVLPIQKPAQTSDQGDLFKSIFIRKSEHDKKPTELHRAFLTRTRGEINCCPDREMRWMVALRLRNMTGGACSKPHKSKRFDSLRGRPMSDVRRCCDGLAFTKVVEPAAPVYQ